MNSVLSSKTFLLAAKIILLACAYFFAGQLALLLAIPPGFATAIFPPMGIALAAVLLWGNSLLVGVFLGAFLLNGRLLLSQGMAIDLMRFFVVIEIAMGCCMAVWMGALLVRRFVGFPNALTDEWKVFLFFLLGGPVACAVSASLGVGALLLHAIIPWGSAGYSWLTWWTGDILGVLIASPMMFLFFAEPRLLWRSRVLTVGLPLTVSLVLLVIVFFNANRSEQQQIKSAFDAESQQLSNRFFNAFQANLKALIPLKSLFVVSDSVSAQHFKEFALDLFAANSSVFSLSWNQKVDKNDRATFVDAMIHEGLHDFSLVEYDEAQRLVPLSDRDTYVIQTYVIQNNYESVPKNSHQLGLDVLSDVGINRVIQWINRSGQAGMTGPQSFVDASGSQFMYSMLLPVYKTRESPVNEILREKLLQGYVAASFSVSALVEKIKSDTVAGQLAISVTDVTNPQQAKILYRDKLDAHKASPFAFSSRMTIAGRDVLFRVEPSAEYVNQMHRVRSWHVLVGGLLFSSLLGGFLLLMTGRSHHIATLVEQGHLELTSVFDESAEAMVVIDEYGFIERVNASACRLFMLPKNELVGLQVEKILPALRELTSGLVDDPLENFSSRLLWSHREALVHSGNGNFIPVELGVSKIVLPNRVLFSCCIHDVTLRKNADRLKNEFIANISYELQMPLAAIKGALNLLGKESSPHYAAKSNSLLSMVSNNVDCLHRLVNDLSDIDRLECGDLELHPELYDVATLFQRTIEQNTSYAIKYGIYLALDNHAFLGRQLFVHVDIERFLQVMANLISNAVRHSDLGGVVTVSAQVRDKVMTVYVDAQGADMTDEFTDEIVQAVSCRDSTDFLRRDGSGLGLSVTRLIVERMGSEICYSCDKQRGSSFHFSLPLFIKESQVALCPEF